MVQNTTGDADWTVCDGVRAPATGVTLIAAPLADGGERAAALPETEVILVPTRPDRTRAPGCCGTAVAARSTSTIALSPVRWASVRTLPPSAPIAPGLFNAIPEAPALSAPVIPGAGEPTSYPLPCRPRSVRSSRRSAPTTPCSTTRCFADGLQPISPVVAAILRNTNSYRAEPAAAAGRRRHRPAAGRERHRRRRVPERAGHPRRRRADPRRRARSGRDPQMRPRASLRCCSGVTLPVADELRTVALVGAGNRAATADRVVLSPGLGYLRLGRRGGVRSSGSATPVCATASTPADPTGRTTSRRSDSPRRRCPSRGRC